MRHAGLFNEAIMSNVGISHDEAIILDLGVKISNSSLNDRELPNNVAISNGNASTARLHFMFWIYTDHHLLANLVVLTNDKRAF